jgi:CcmD family protein
MPVQFLLNLTLNFVNGMSLLQVPGDFMRETGKIYVVYGVLVVVFLGIAGFLFILERRIRKIEKQIQNDESRQ